MFVERVTFEVKLLIVTMAFEIAPAPPVVSVVIPPVMITLFVIVFPAISKVPLLLELPLMVKVPVPRALLLEIRRIPELTVTPPVKVFAPPKTARPGPKVVRP